jgi:glucose-6-phosphate isomerase
MESNGKCVQMDGATCRTSTGSLYFGEPGTNGQHSFYQLLHQGRTVPAEFIGFKKSQNPISLDGEPVSNHDELMSNFFAQPDALALGKTPQQLAAEGVPSNLVPHKTFPGDRPSLSLLLPTCDAKHLGLLLALYEHRTAVQGWIWGINSFDQWGVQLGKVLATGVGKYFQKARQGPADASAFLSPTKSLLSRYLEPYDSLALLQQHAHVMKCKHLRTLLSDDTRNNAMFVEGCGIVLDYCRQKLSTSAMDVLIKLAQDRGLDQKRRNMFVGSKINETEGRSVLHVALRMPRHASLVVDGKNVVAEVWGVLDAIKGFSDKVRSGEWKGHTGKPLTDVLCIGIGGSYLGVEFVLEALRTDPRAEKMAKGRNLRFLANVDPIDVKRALTGLSAETTLVVVVSKTFTTAETMLNARTVKAWLIKELGSETCVAKHVVACSTALEKTKAFGIDPKNVFGFWDWVGGRFSVWSAVGMLGLSLQYGFDIMEEFLQGARAMDEHFCSEPPDKNLPVIIGLLSVWNTSCLGYEGCAVLPYCQALVRFVAHIQQLDMESNGKCVQMDGSACTTSTGALYFGEPGTNGQHSFYQLLHQGRAVPAEFIGFKASQNPIMLEGEPVSNHDELMSNFFAQPDALAMGKTPEQLAAEGVPQELIPHKTFPGDRPSLSLLLPVCDARNLGLLLALYEHRTAVQGWMWGINSFDQWGVQLGKVLATEVGKYVAQARKGSVSNTEVPSQTRAMISQYL